MFKCYIRTRAKPLPAYLLGYGRSSGHPRGMHGVRMEGGRLARSPSCRPVGRHVAGHPPKITAPSQAAAGERETSPQPSRGTTRGGFSTWQAPS